MEKQTFVVLHWTSVKKAGKPLRWFKSERRAGVRSLHCFIHRRVCGELGWVGSQHALRENHCTSAPACVLALHCYWSVRDQKPKHRMGNLIFLSFSGCGSGTRSFIRALCMLGQCLATESYPWVEWTYFDTDRWVDHEKLLSTYFTQLL